MSAFNGAGTFVITGVGLPYVTGTTISSTVANQLNTDLATGLSNCVTKDGQTTPTANIPMGGFKVTGIGAATTLGDALSFGRAATITTLDMSGAVNCTSSGGFVINLSGTEAARFSAPLGGSLITGTMGAVANMDASGGQIGALRGFYTGGTGGLAWGGATFITGTNNVSIDVKVNANGVTLLPNASAWSAISDYRAKDVHGDYAASGAIIDAVPVHLAQLKDKTQPMRPMFLAHEVAEGGADFAVHGAKDAVDENGEPMMQKVDTTDPLIPILWAEVRAMRQRLAAAGL